MQHSFCTQRDKLKQKTKQNKKIGNRNTDLMGNFKHSTSLKSKMGLILHYSEPIIGMHVEGTLKRLIIIKDTKRRLVFVKCWLCASCYFFFKIYSSNCTLYGLETVSI